MSRFVGLHEYPYTRLTASNGLRLLRLRAGVQDEGLHCELFISHLDGADARSMTNDEPRPDYEAVSWFWGRGIKDRLLRVDQDGRSLYATHFAKSGGGPPST